MASPHVAGAAAQFLSANPGATPNLLLYSGFGDPDRSCGEPPPPDDTTCQGRCGKYDGTKPCQCDWQCYFYGDCCASLCLWSEQ